MDENILLKIKDADFDENYQLGDISHYNLRTSARGIVLANDKLALLYVSKYDYYKLPGGGIESGETIEQAFIREVIEEVGCKVGNLKQFGQIIEYRSQFKLKQTSYVITGEVVGEIGANKLEQSEIDEGFELLWVPVDSAIKTMTSSNPSNYEGQFIVKRDLFILEHCLSSTPTHSNATIISQKIANTPLIHIDPSLNSG